MSIGGYHVWTTRTAFVDFGPRHPTNPPPPPPDAPLHLKQAFVERLTRDPRLTSHLPKDKNDINQFLDWIRPLNANGEFTRWDPSDITRFLLDYIACNFGSGRQSDAQAVLKLADRTCPSGESLMICGLLNGNPTVVNAVLDAHARLGHRGFFEHYQNACVERGAPASRLILAPYVLHRAISERNDLKQQPGLLQDAAFQMGLHHLHLAVEVAAGTEIVEALIQACLSQGRSLDAVDNEGQTALFLAVASNRYEAAELLLRYGADVNLLPPSTKAADLLVVALSGVDVRIVELLLPRFGGDVLPYLSRQNLEGTVYLRPWLKGCIVEYVETYLNNDRVKIDSSEGFFEFLTGSTPIEVKARLVANLAKRGASLSGSCGGYPTVIHYAMAQKDNTWLVPALIKGGLKPNLLYAEMSSLGIAVKARNDYAVELLRLAGYKK